MVDSVFLFLLKTLTRLMVRLKKNSDVSWMLTVKEINGQLSILIISIMGGCGSSKRGPKPEKGSPLTGPARTCYHIILDRSLVMTDTNQ